MQPDRDLPGKDAVGGEPPAGGPEVRNAPTALLLREPFRLLFPVALVVTLAGVALWPLLHVGWLEIYPGTMHARVMSAAFVGFLLGFLGTALPRLLEASPLRTAELVLLLAGWLGSVAAYFLSRTATGDLLLALTLWLFVFGMLWRWVAEARDSPPPGFPVALAGLFSGGLGALALAWRGGEWMGPVDYWVARLLVYQGAFLIPLIGIGPFLFPRFLGLPSPHRFAAGRTSEPAWWGRFLRAALAASLVVLSFLIEAAGEPLAGMLLRAAVVALYFLVEVPLYRRARVRSTLTTALRVAVLSSILALAWAAFDPARRLGILHLLLFSGTGLAMLAVGVRVVLGHAGRHDLLEGRIRWMQVLTGLAVLGAATRVSAEFLARIRLSHLDYAALTWAIVVVLWLWKLGRWLWVEEPERKGRCPRARRQRTRAAE